MQTLIGAALVAAAFFGMVYVRDRGVVARLAWIAVFAGVAAYQATALVRIAVREIAQPPLWDFKVFWMVGKICAGGGNIYDVASYAPYAALLNPGNDVEFNTIAVKIGMPYPPPAAVLFCPLGHLARLTDAMTIWYGVLFIAIALSIVALWRQFLAADGIRGLIVAAVCVLALPGTALTVGFGQLNFFAIPLLVLIWRERVLWRIGALLAPLIVIRPLALLLGLYFVVRRAWSVPLALVATCGALFAVAMPIVGFDAFVSYLHHNPTQRYPQIYFRSWDSLYKILVMIGNERDGFFSLATHPLFDVIAAGLLLGAAYVCHVAGKAQRTVCLSMLLALGLFVYPNTGTHYSVLLLVPMLSMWKDREQLKLSETTAIAILGLQYFLLMYRAGAFTSGLVCAVDALLFALLALRTQYPRLTLPHPSLAVSRT